MKPVNVLQIGAVALALVALNDGALSAQARTGTGRIWTDTRVEDVRRSNDRDSGRDKRERRLDDRDSDSDSDKRGARMDDRDSDSDSDSDRKVKRDKKSKKQKSQRTRADGSIMDVILGRRR